MSETPSTPTPGEPGAAPDAEPKLGESGIKALQAERDAHKQAKKDLSELQSQLDKLNAEKLSDLERAQSAAKEATERAAAAEQSALRFRLAAKHGISDEDAELFLTGGSEDAMQKQAERFAARVAQERAPGTPRPDPTQGVGGGVPLNSDALTEALRAAVGA